MRLDLQPGLTQPAARLLDIQKEPLQRAFKIWLREMAGYNVESYLYYPLKHEYTEAAMSFQALKPQDFARIIVEPEEMTTNKVEALIIISSMTDFDFAVDMCTEEDLFSELEVAQED
ncbi:hypothetical protein PSHT_11027 [Puccinia striiformis]|uniref:Uncharacterized protein n=3 Tax=Puccinia striiformis TaxID=27350 RepID=A0A0L0VU09_9BASI|nr:hypothetical protein H4Q26_012709 [Puccinia striiformis f. sp. tritici PST-130]KNF02774.1 hypothetical protein PSTG_04059 [Puccinia striiformis f. sp. tritici PST-78]POW04895.1 hypothetical protein PSHT_11027 [Puccinia striiformis]POW13161.1 hypothetical protein PSTT_03883 [Puccinia striiformis]